jgi:hypothetical protein
MEINMGDRRMQSARHTDLPRKVKYNNNQSMVLEENTTKIRRKN